MKRVHFYQGLTEMQLCVGPELCQCVPAASPAFFLFFFFWLLLLCLHIF